MAGGGTTWQGLVGSAANGEILIDEEVFNKLNSAVYDLVGWIRGVQEMARAVPIQQVSPLPDGADVARTFGVKTARGLADVLDSHLTVLTDMADTLRAVGTHYRYTEYLSSDSLSKTIMHMPLPEGVRDVLVAPEKSFLRDADTEKVEVGWVDPQSMTFDELFELGAGINTVSVNATSELWTTMAATLRNSFGVFDTAVGSKQDQWRGEGGDRAFAAARRYADDVNNLLDAMSGIVAKLDDARDALGQTAGAMPQTTDVDELVKFTMTPVYQSFMQALYTGPLGAAVQLPKLPQPTSMISGNGGSPPPGAPPSGPGADLTDNDRPGAGPRPGRDDDIVGDIAEFGPDGPADPDASPPVDGADPLPADDLPGPGASTPGDLPDAGPVFGDSVGTPRSGDLGDPANPGAGNLGNPAGDLGPAERGLDPSGPGPRTGDQPGSPVGPDSSVGGPGVAPYLGGPGPTQATGNPSNARPFPGRVGATGPGSGSAAPARAAEPVQRPAAARPMARAGIGPDDAVRAGSRSGVPGGPGASGPVAGRRRDGEDEQEHKSADYPESEEPLNEAIGQLPPVYRPVIDR
ncbi:hypothetical protein IU448_20810 [Nocardia flavorosea]|uniref:hypothetical protein n=1 Tax=Nocardia flavorosea TaxID=53429 RepID=UPI0018944F22|nr:hypothetical protein [Nocardia flavorosea]MBF6351433.1 hypothetical protein [Nocardia flavorosea]